MPAIPWRPPITATLCFHSSKMRGETPSALLFFLIKMGRQGLVAPRAEPPFQIAAAAADPVAGQAGAVAGQIGDRLTALFFDVLVFTHVGLFLRRALLGRYFCCYHYIAGRPPPL